MTWILLIMILAALYGAYKAGKAKQRAEFRRIGRKIEVRRIAAKQCGENKYDTTEGRR